MDFMLLMMLRDKLFLGRKLTHTQRPKGNY